jgi:ubiquinone/menaquinone biosynthesis C-methylase UbiE/uncharacterized protein YbaR (Trm112 family)
VKLNLLDFLVCPGCGGPLTCFPFRERLGEPGFVHFCGHWCAAGDVSAEAVDRQACLRCHRREIVEGVLWCEPCLRAFPIHETLPEILPRDLENADVLHAVLKGRRYLSGVRGRFVREHGWIARAARERAAAGDPDGDGNDGLDGSRYKRAEVKLTRREDLPDGFFNPGLAEPFVSLRPSHSIEKILRFMVPLSHADWRFSDPVLDLGVGYAWTTEWLMKLGFNAIGVDLNRDYLKVGIRRTGGNLPPLVVADVENLPFRRGMFQGVLFFDAFHHVADRVRALRGCAEALRPGGRIVMAEPGEKHETHPASVHVMRTYGILEKGITEAEFREMAGKAGFAEAEKHPYAFGEAEILVGIKPGDRVYTSRGPSCLRAEIVPEPDRLEIVAGREATLKVRVRNAGDTVWLRRTADGLGRVRVGFQLKSAEGTLIEENYLRLELPRDVGPGEAAEMTAGLPAIDKPGDYIIEIDAVDEGITWFKDIDYNPVTLVVKVRS